MATHTRVTEWTARLVQKALDKIPDEEAVKWDLSVIAGDEDLTEPTLVLWLAIDDPDPAFSVESTFAIPLYEVTPDIIAEHVQKAWDYCQVERMAMSMHDDD